jgi:hypothetical protein
MFSVKPLHNSQSDWGGAAACTVCCCTLSRYILLFRDQLDLNHPTALQHVDSAISEAVGDWLELSAGFLYPAEVLRSLPALAEDLCVLAEVPVNAEGPLYDDDGHLIVQGLAAALEHWDREHATSTTCAIVRGGYTFLLFKLKANYFIIDTHANSIERHAHKLAEYAHVQSDSTGLLLSTLFFQEVINFVQQYSPTVTGDQSLFNTSSNQLDLTYLALTE